MVPAGWHIVLMFLYIAAGLSGFALLHLFDFVSLKRLPFLKPMVWGLGSVLWLYSLIMLATGTDKIDLVPPISTLGWTIAFVFGIAFFHALFISLPFTGTYVAKGVGNVMVTTGLYAMMRHPGVLLLSLALIGLSLGTGSVGLIIATPLWIIADVILVYLQDRYVFPRMFPGYTAYQKRTPMLIPTRNSIREYFRTRNEKIGGTLK